MRPGLPGRADRPGRWGRGEDGGGTRPGGPLCRRTGADVRDKDAFVRARDQLVAPWGALHVLVNNAGHSKTEPLMEISPETFDAVV
ncbi:SDR family NAD(P)-dependent oxidoreductase [Streptomyces sp. cg40]|uniref:SDR family NAD(P)-dependent oxidoreductase n=1 Tax=Streptomyces sp. cg40 TaxID=3419764 RepID=UPI003D078976